MNMKLRFENMHAKNQITLKTVKKIIAEESFNLCL